MSNSPQSTSSSSSRSISYSTNLQGLIDIQTKLNTQPAVQMPEMEGMFHRVQDFTLSHANLMTQFVNEYMVAHIEFPRAKDIDELMGNVSKEYKKMQVYSLGEDHFTSRELSPALRHFVNDSCRLLEPMLPILAAKFSDVRVTRSAGSYIEKLMVAGKNLPFDTQYLVELYEVWNDYKHRETTGLHVTPWKYESGEVISPQLALPRLNKPIQKLNNLDVDQFVYGVDAKILQFLNFLI